MYIFGFFILFLLGFFGNDISSINSCLNTQLEPPVVIDAAFTSKNQLLAYKLNSESIKIKVEASLKVNKAVDYGFQKPFINILFSKSNYWVFFINLVNVCPIENVWVPTVNDVYLGSPTPFSPEAKSSFVKDILNVTKFMDLDKYCYAPISTIHHTTPFLNHGTASSYWLRNKARMYCLQYGTSDYNYPEALKVASMFVSTDVNTQAIKDLNLEKTRLREMCKANLDTWSPRAKKLRRR